MNDRDRLNAIARAAAKMESDAHWHLPPSKLLAHLESIRLLATQTAEFIEANKEQIERDLGIPLYKTQSATPSEVAD